MRKLIIILLFAATASASIFLNSFNSGRLGKKMKVRHDLDRTHMGSEVLDNILIRPQGMAYKRPGTEFIADTNDEDFVAEVPAVPPVPDDYTFTIISEGGSLWYVPLFDRVMDSLDAGGAARDVGGGIVGLPWIGHPFTIGDTIRITNTTFYNNQFTLEAGTTANELQITYDYNAETFDGTEIIVKRLTVNSGFGTMVRADDGNIYYGHTWNPGNSTYVTKVETDGTLVYDFLNHSWTGAESVAIELVLSQNDVYLYICLPNYLEKYELSGDNAGDLVWSVDTATAANYDCAIDADDNIYIPDASLSDYTRNVVKFAAADGTRTEMGAITGVYNIAVSDELGVVVSGGRKSWVNIITQARFYNLSVRKLDDSSGTQIILGGLYYTSLWNSYGINKQCIAIYGSYIYVLMFSPTSTLYKLDVDLNIITEVAGPSNGQGIYFDLWGNLVVINPTVTGSTDILWFYDTDLNYLSKLDNMYTLLLDGWDVLAYTKGNAVFDGALTDYVPAVPGYWNKYGSRIDRNAVVRLIPFEYSVDDAYVLEFGHQYIGLLRTTR